MCFLLSTVSFTKSNRPLSGAVSLGCVYTVHPAKTADNTALQYGFWFWRGSSTHAFTQLVANAEVFTYFCNQLLSRLAEEHNPGCDDQPQILVAVGDDVFREDKYKDLPSEFDALARNKSASGLTFPPQNATSRGPEHKYPNNRCGTPGPGRKRVDVHAGHGNSRAPTGVLCLCK